MHTLDVISNPNLLTLLFIGLVGLMWGDFMGMALQRTLKVATQTNGYDELPHHHIFGGRSICYQCGEKIPFYNNIPLISWIRLKGVSSCCGVKIPKSYPLTEILFMICTPIAANMLGIEHALIFLVALSICYIAFIVDLKTMLIPVEGNILLVMLSCYVASLYDPNFQSAIIYGMSIWVAMHILNGLSPIQIIGEGDIPIISSMAIISFGYVFNIGIIVSSIVSIILFAFKLRSTGSYSSARVVPFGPGLCAGYMCCLAIVLYEI